MHDLDDAQWDDLRELHELASLADMETDAALYSGNLDDAKAAIRSVATATDALSLPDGLARDLQRLALEAVKAADGGDVKTSAGNAMRAVDQIEQAIESWFAAAGRRL
jgi:hypothetical protein